MPHNIYAAARGSHPGNQPVLPHWNQLVPEAQQMLTIVIRHATSMGVEQGAAAPWALIQNLMQALGMPPATTVTLEQILAAAKAKFSPEPPKEDAAPAEPAAEVGGEASGNAGVDASSATKKEPPAA
jgi:hypothetical protein